MVTVVAVIIVLVAVWIGIWEPYRGAMDRLDRQISSRQRGLTEVQQLSQQIVALQQQLSTGAGQVDADGPLFARVEKVTVQAGVKEQLSSMRPQPTVQQGEYRQQQVELKLEKVSLQQLVRFLHALEFGRQGIQVKSMRIKRRFEDHSSLDVSLSVFSLEQGS